MDGVIIRAAAASDADAIQAIYAHHVLNGVGTFEEVPPGVDEMRGRMKAVQSAGMPWMVAEQRGRVLGYAYAGPFRTRAAYRYTAEDSVYVAADAHGRGVGRAVLQAVIAACEGAGVHQLLGVIGNSANEGSIALHRACGFTHCGVTPGVGWKKGRWIDVVWMQLALNGGLDATPHGPGLAL